MQARRRICVGNAPRGTRVCLRTGSNGARAMVTMASDDTPPLPAEPVPPPSSPFPERDPVPVELPPDEPLPDTAPPPLRV